MRLAVVLLLLLLGAASIGRAAEYRFDSDSPALRQRMAHCQPGDIITLEGGVTYRGPLTISASGNESAPVILRGAPNHGVRPILTATTGNVLSVRASHVIVDNVEITSGSSPTLLRGFYTTGDAVTLRNSVVHDVRAQGIHVSDAAGSVTLDHVEVFRCGNGDKAHQVYACASLTKYPDATFTMTHCYLHDGLGGNNVKSRVPITILRSNWIEGSALHELDLIGADPKNQKQHTPFRHRAEVVGNVIRKVDGAAWLIARLGTDGLAPSYGSYRFAFNTFVIGKAKTPEAFTVLKVQGPVEQVQFDSNIVWRLGNRPVVLTAFNEKFPSPDVRFSGAGNWLPPGSKGVPAGITFQSVPPADLPDIQAGQYRPLESLPGVKAPELDEPSNANASQRTIRGDTSAGALAPATDGRL